MRVDVHVLLEARVGRALHPAVGLDGERLGRAGDPGVGRARQPGGLRVVEGQLGELRELGQLTSGSGVEMLQETGRAGGAGLRREVFGHGSLQL